MKDVRLMDSRIIQRQPLLCSIQQFMLSSCMIAGAFIQSIQSVFGVVIQSEI